MRKRKLIAFSAALTLITCSSVSCGNTAEPASQVNIQTEVVDATSEIIDETIYESVSDIMETTEAETENEETPQVDVQLPDLSEYGIDTSDLKLSAQSYSMGVDDHTYSGVDFSYYTNDDGDEFLFYPDGSLYQYLSGNNAYGEEYSLTEDEYKTKAYEILKQLVPDLDGYEETHNVGGYEIALERKGACEDTGAHAEINLAADGSVESIFINKNDITDTEVIEKLREKAQEAAESRWNDLAQFNYVTIDNCDMLFTSGDKKCGIFTYTISEGEPEAFGCYKVLVCDE